MKKYLLLSFISSLFFCTICTKVNAQEYHIGMPDVFVLETVPAMAITPWVKMTHGSFLNPGANQGAHPTGTTHAIITASSKDMNTCDTKNGTNIFLTTLPDPGLVPWNEETDGKLRVMRLNDTRPGNPSGVLGSRVTYYFIPDSARNVVVVYFAFVAQKPDHPTYAQNPKFMIEVLDANGIRLPTANPKDAYFLVNPAGLNGENPDSHDLILKDNGKYYVCGEDQWSNWFPVAFDLRDFKDTKVQLRIETADCSPAGHYAYGYFTIKGFNGTVNVASCAKDKIELSVPQGFAFYSWKINGVTQPITGYKFEKGRNPADTSIVCVLTANNGATMTFTANINYYEFEPDFEWYVGGGNCKYDVQFKNTSKMFIEKGSTSVAEEIKHVRWDFGDGKPETEENEKVDPVHRYDTAGTYTVTLTLYDNDGQCDSTITKKITLDPQLTCEGYDTIRVCSERFLRPVTFQQYFDTTWLEPGVKEVVFKGACVSGCDSTVHVLVIDDLPHGSKEVEITVCHDRFPYYDYEFGHTFTKPGLDSVIVSSKIDSICDSIVYVMVGVRTPQVEISLEGDLCDDVPTSLIAEDKSKIPSAAPQFIWNNGLSMEELQITEPGTYIVEMIDDLGCIATDKYKVAACLPYVVLPNAFTPSNHDGINDYFELPQREFIQSLELAIYDRYGTLVYNTDRKDFKWDGTVNKQIYYNATYVYVLTVIDYNGITTRYTGSITTL